MALMMVCLEGLKGNKHLFCFCPLPLCRLRKKHLWPLLSCIQFKTVFIMVSTTFCFAFQFPPFSVPSIGFSSIRPHSISPSYPRFSVLHTVPNLHFWFKNSTFWKISSDVIFSFCIEFDGRFEIKMPKKLMNFEFLPQNCSKLNFSKFIFGSKPTFFARKIQFLVKLA